ncbi:MAG: MerR family transcriptional regulator [Romboutsia sp.]
MKLSIGQVSKLFEISSDTLRHYDKIGILKPEINKNNGYRCYSLQHLDKLSLILGTKYLGISLSDIKETIESEDIKEYKNLIIRQDELIKEKIEKLKNLQKTLDSANEVLETIINFENQYDFTKLKDYKMDYKFYGIDIKNLLEGEFYKIYLSNLEKELQVLDEEEYFYTYKILEDKEVKENENVVFIRENEKNRYIIQKYIGNDNLPIIRKNISGNMVSTKFYGTQSEIDNHLILLNKYFNLKGKNEFFIMYEFYLPKKESKEEYFVEIVFKI